MMKKSNTLPVASAILLTLALGQASADLVWFTDAIPGTEIVDVSGTPLDASANNPLTGDFLQLIYSPSGMISPAATHDVSPTGVTGDNVVIDAGFFGYGTDGFLTPTVPGAMQFPRFAGTYNAGDVFFVRAWTEPASNFAAGEISTSLMLRYGNSSRYSYLANPAGDNFAFDTHGGMSGFAAIMSPIPEPTTMGVMLMGLGLLARRLRARR